MALTGGVVAAQNQGVPRTAWGAPDLQGVWDRRALTPFQRPRVLEGQEVFTAEEVASFEAKANAALAAIGAYSADVLPPGIRSRFAHDINGITMHVLEAGYEATNRPGVLLLHGFPELTFSWCKVIPALAAAGFHVIAPDLRGYGRTSGWDVGYDDDLGPFQILNHVRDMLALVSAFGHRSVAAVIGHDFGSPVAAWCAVTRPDVFRSVVLMSAPFGGTPALPFNTANQGSPRAAVPARSREGINDALGALERPRKHYQWYYSTREANDNMHHAPQGVHAFLRWDRGGCWRRRDPGEHQLRVPVLLRAPLDQLGDLPGDRSCRELRADRRLDGRPWRIQPRVWGQTRNRILQRAQDRRLGEPQPAMRRRLHDQHRPIGSLRHRTHAA